jgi:2-polyprenyl-3-methyl-5-hydroxy-6-metoxy-1,4-benzoquinol methylase
MEIKDIKKIAEEDAGSRGYSASKYSDWIEDILSKASGKVLDAGSGDGAFSIPLLKRGFDVVSSDLAHPRLMGLKPTQPLLVECDATYLPFKPGTFDTILFVEVLEHLPDGKAQADCIRGFIGALKPNGRIVLTTPNRPVYRVMLKLWGWFGGQKPDPTHFSELSLGGIRALIGEWCEIELVRGKVGLIPLKPLQRLFARWPGLCYDIMVVAKPRAVKQA